METKTKNVIVKICAGTHCYLMGGAELQLFHEYLPVKMRESVIIAGSPCLAICNCEGTAKPPFVMVNERILSQATIQSLLEAVNAELTN